MRCLPMSANPPDQGMPISMRALVSADISTQAAHWRRDGKKELHIIQSYQLTLSVIMEDIRTFPPGVLGQIGYNQITNYYK
jgi:hypothetical protein